MNWISDSAPCSVWVHLNANDSLLGAQLALQTLPGIVPNEHWNSLDLPSPLTFEANEEFCVAIGPIPGGMQMEGWNVLMDDDGGLYERSGRSTTGHYGVYRRMMPHSLIIRAGGEYLDNFFGSVGLVSGGPPDWTYDLSHELGCMSQLAFTRFCPGTVGSVTGDATATWYVLPNGDGNDGDTIIFRANTPLTSGSIAGFVLSHPWCSDTIGWNVGDSSGTIEGPLPSDPRSVGASPVEYSLTAYPNPFNPATNVWFGVEKAGRVTIDVYNVAGQKVTTLVDGEFARGYHVADFDARELPTGIYFAQIRAGEFVKTEKMVLLK
jgi:hypothetical protein